MKHKWVYFMPSGKAKVGRSEKSCEGTTFSSWNILKYNTDYVKLFWEKLFLLVFFYGC